MAPTLATACAALPPEGAELRLGRPGASFAAPTLATACAALPPEGAELRLGRPGASFAAPTLATVLPFRRLHGFTLIELLVALAAMALMAGLSWRGLDGMLRAQSQLQQRADAVLTLQAGLTQWAADLDAVLQLPQTPALDWDGRGLRLVRRSTATPGDGVLVVAWARRDVNGAGQWLRWQSPPQFTRGDLQSAWNKAAQWSQNPGEDEKRYEVRIAALEQWQIFYFRGNAWTNPLSSGGVAAPVPVPGTSSNAAPDVTLPDGVRLVLMLPLGQALSGTLTRDWIRPVLGGGKS